MLASLLLVSLCAGTAAMFDSRLDVHWELWKKTHGKIYQNEVSRLMSESFLFISTESINVHCFFLFRVLFPCLGGERAPQGLVGEEPDAYHYTQPGGLDGTSHLRSEHELHGRPG